MVENKFESAVGSIGFRTRAAEDETQQRQQEVRVAVQRARDGDSDALRFLYIRYSDNVYGYVRSIVHDPHEAEDVTQSVFTKLMTALPKYNDRGTPFFAWLIRMARNVAIDHLRENRVHPMDRVADLTETPAPEPEEAMALRELFANLPEQQREVVMLRHVAGLSPGEIAERMGRTEGAIHGLHHRGRSTMREELRKLSLAPSTMRVVGSA
jgi:RNA polymerase sigma-70 factor, ECF subfamily